MDIERKACCARGVGWSLIGVVIAMGWGMGNLANGMSALSAFAIPGLIMLVIIGVMVLAVLEVPWFKKLCTCPTGKDPQDKVTNTPASLIH
ncbi:MAG: hypothetical protein QNJ78_12785 [Gammaproteobacteria bacterium]|nr:hypothetical protein [Gammaproteobacteria bacterium]